MLLDKRDTPMNPTTHNERWIKYNNQIQFEIYFEIGIISNIFGFFLFGWMNKIEEMIFAELYKRDIRKKEKEELIKQMEIQKRVQDRN